MLYVFGECWCTFVHFSGSNIFLLPFCVQDNYDYYDTTDVYHSFFNTYEIDCEYFKYCEELSKKIKVCIM